MFSSMFSFAKPTLPSCCRSSSARTGSTARQGPVGRLDLERVALRVDRVEVDLLEHLAAVALEAAGEISDLRREQHTRVEGTARGDRATRRAPVRNLPALDVAGAEGKVGVVG